MAARAPYAPSMCIHRLCTRAIAAISASGSMEPVFTVPAEATTAIGLRPCASSLRIARSNADGTIPYESSHGT